MAIKQQLADLAKQRDIIEKFMFTHNIRRPMSSMGINILQPCHSSTEQNISTTRTPTPSPTRNTYTFLNSGFLFQGEKVGRRSADCRFKAPLYWYPFGRERVQLLAQKPADGHYN